MGPVIIAENVGPIRSVDSGEESGSCGDASGAASAPDDAAKWRACSNVARPDGVAAVEEAIAELDGGRIEAAKARLLAFVAAARSHVTPGTNMALGEHETPRDR